MTELSRWICLVALVAFLGFAASRALVTRRFFLTIKTAWLSTFAPGDWIETADGKFLIVTGVDYTTNNLRVRPVRWYDRLWLWATTWERR